MSILSTTRKSGPYVGNGVTATFPFAFKVFLATEVVVVRTNLAGVETTLALTTDYSVALNANQSSSPGGSITVSAIPVNGYLLTITSNMQALQQLDLTNQGGFYPSVVNDALDRVTILIQQVAEQASRAVKTGISSSIDPATLINSLNAASYSATASAAAAANSATAAANAVPVGSLTYTPVNKVGDTMTGNLALPGINVGGSGVMTSLGSAALLSAGTIAINAAITLTAAQSGAFFYVVASTANYNITLPTLFSGMRYKFFGVGSGFTVNLVIPAATGGLYLPDGTTVSLTAGLTYTGRNLAEIGTEFDIISDGNSLFIVNTSGRVITKPAVVSNQAINRGQVLNVAPVTQVVLASAAASTTTNNSVSITAPCAGYIIGIASLNMNAVAAAGVGLSIVVNGVVWQSDNTLLPMTEYAMLSVASGAVTTVNAQTTTGATAPGNVLSSRVFAIFIPSP